MKGVRNVAPFGTEEAIRRLVETYSAMLLRLPAATVGTRLARGRERLRRMLEEDE